MKVGDIVRWTMLEHFGNRGTSILGVIVEMHIGNGANVAWFADNGRVAWTPISELEVISEAVTNRDKDFVDILLRV